MEVSIIAIGDELLIGQVTDTNSGWIARHLTPFGWKVKSVRVVADDRQEIGKAVTEAMAQTDVVLMTGGLGPTKDDITKQTLCDYFGGTLVLDEATRENVGKVFERRHLTMNSLTASQAMVPSCCRVIQNEVGTAPIMWFERDGKVLVSMPGVPHETATMMQRAVIPQLIKRFSSDVDIEHRTFVVIDYTESDLAIALSDFENSLPQGIHLAYLPKPGIIRLRLSGMSHSKERLSAQMDSLTERLHATLGDAIVCDGDHSLPEVIGQMLRERGLTLASAESCTGGNIAHVITEVPGSSEYFVGTVVSYCNRIKHQLLGVPGEVLDTVGAVSEPTVAQMVRGACQLLGTDCAVSTSGIAGPGGGTPDKPVGTVWMAAKCGDRVVTHCAHLPGDRSRVIDRATTEVLKMLLKLLRESGK